MEAFGLLLPALLSNNHASSHRLQKLNDSLGCLDLVVPQEKMEEGRCTDDVDCSIQLLQRRIGVEDVSLDEFCLEGSLVEKEVIAIVPEVDSEIGGVNVLRGRTIIDEPANVLAKAAAQIKKFFSTLDALEGFRISRELSDAEVQEGPIANAGIRKLT